MVAHSNVYHDDQNGRCGHTACVVYAYRVVRDGCTFYVGHNDRVDLTVSFYVDAFMSSWLMFVLRTRARVFTGTRFVVPMVVALMIMTPEFIMIATTSV